MLIAALPNEQVIIFVPDLALVCDDEFTKNVCAAVGKSHSRGTDGAQCVLPLTTENHTTGKHLGGRHLIPEADESFSFYSRRLGL